MTIHPVYFTGLLLLASGLANTATLDPGTASRIAMAKQQIAQNPAQPDGYVSLSLALVKAARATDCDEYLKQADQAVADSLRIAPANSAANFEARKALVAVRLAEARYTEALVEAQALSTGKCRTITSCTAISPTPRWRSEIMRLPKNPCSG
jgi:hypothetical protein